MDRTIKIESRGSKEGGEGAMGGLDNRKQGGGEERRVDRTIKAAKAVTEERGEWGWGGPDNKDGRKQ